MNRLKKIGLLALRPFFRHGKLHVKIEIKLFDLNRVQILPCWFYRALYWTSMNMVKISCLKKEANWLIHHIPFNVRFQLA
jgi:hypothetical protein